MKGSYMFLCAWVSPYIHVLSNKCLTCLPNEHPSQLKAGSGSVEVELAIIGRLALHQGYTGSNLIMRWEGLGVFSLERSEFLKYPLPRFR